MKGIISIIVFSVLYSCNEANNNYMKLKKELPSKEVYLIPTDYHPFIVRDTILKKVWYYKRSDLKRDSVLLFAY